MNNYLTNIHNCYIVELTKIHNPAGNITIVQNDKHQPFTIKRIYYLYDVPGGSERGAHAHKTLHQLIVAASGSFDVIIDDGQNKKIVHLNRPNFGFLIHPTVWNQIVNFSSGAICMVLASDKYDELDYIRDYDEFLQWKSLK
ncbi:MAG: FdtA/QdtA family cupin domain-containing protein [Bacteroidales bacterium]|nr:FdtA/QdtA family cupin domain-containing protein [Bacteroidales bacterium]MCF8390279.1 FdtA/QdtA family cupin domain-containing protein [Bacteroidales bacterium]